MHWCVAVSWQQGAQWQIADMDTTTSIKMTTLAIQNLFSYVEEENLSALKAHLDRFKEVDGRSDVCIWIPSFPVEEHSSHF